MLLEKDEAKGHQGPKMNNWWKRKGRSNKTNSLPKVNSKH
jgi:hypothetical protein